MAVYVHVKNDFHRWNALFFVFVRDGYVAYVLGGGELREGLLSIAFEYPAVGDPGATRELLGQLPESERAGAMMGMVMGIAGKDPAAAAEFAKEEGDGEGVGTAVEQWSVANPEGAAAGFIGERLAEGAARDAAVVALAEAIKGSDPEGARAWARTITDAALGIGIVGFAAGEVRGGAAGFILDGV